MLNNPPLGVEPVMSLEYAQWESELQLCRQQLSAVEEDTKCLAGRLSNPVANGRACGNVRNKAGSTLKCAQPPDVFKVRFHSPRRIIGRVGSCQGGGCVEQRQSEVNAGAAHPFSRAVGATVSAASSHRVSEVILIYSLLMMLTTLKIIIKIGTVVLAAAAIFGIEIQG